MEKEKERVYIIPGNYAETGKVLNGMFYFRNLVEAIILTLLLFVFVMQVLPLSINIRIGIAVITCLPLLFVGAIGIRSHSLTEYMGIFYRYLRDKRKMRYRRIMKRPTKADMEQLGYVPQLKTRQSVFNKKKKANDLVEKASVTEDKDADGADDIKEVTLVKDLKKMTKMLFPQSLRKNKRTQHFVQELIPLDRIENGIVITRDNRYIKILEVLPTNMQSLHKEEINILGIGYEEWWRVAPKNTQVKVITQKKTSFDYIEKLVEKMKSETNVKAKEMCSNYITHIKEMTQVSGLTRRSFLIFEYERDGVHANDMDKIYSQLSMLEGQARQIFGHIGNKIANPIDEAEENEFIESILYELLNRKTSIIEPYKERKRRVYEDTAKAYRKDPIFIQDLIHPTYLICPRGIDTTHPDYILADGMYITYLAISSDGYPDHACLGWVGRIIDAGEGFDIDMFFREEDVDKTLENIQRKLVMNELSYRDANRTSSKSNTMAEAIGAGYAIKQHIMEGNENIYNTTVIITISAETRKELDDRRIYMRNLLKRNSIGFSEFTHQMEDCFLSTLPFNNIDRMVFDKNKRNMLTQSLTSMYPFLSYELADKTGVAIGVADNGSLVYINQFNNDRLKNANMFIVGNSGSGKTFFVSLMALRMRLLQIQTIIIAPYKGYEYQRACIEMGGSFIKIAIGSEDCINVLDILVIESEFKNYVGGTQNLIAQKIETIITFIALIYPELDNAERNSLDRAIRVTYAKKDIFLEDPLSIYKNGKNGKIKEMPILGDLHTVIKENSELELKGVLNALEPYVYGRMKDFNHPTNVDLTNKYIVIDVSELNEDLLSVGMFIATSFANAIINADRTQQKAIIFDEAWRVLNAETDKSEEVGKFVMTIARTIRGLGGSAIFATQDIKDLLQNDRARTILTQCDSKMILGLENFEADAAQSILKLNDDEKRRIIKAGKGEGLFCAGKDRIMVQVVASKKEKRLISTDSKEAKEYEREAQAKAKLSA